MSIDLLAASAAAAATRFSQVSVDGDDIYWLEQRPHEGGRTALVRRDAHGSVADVTPADVNVRTRVYEYGGGAYVVSNGVALYSNFRDGRVYRLRPGHEPEPLTPAGDFRYGDLSLDPLRRRLLAVRQQDNTIAIVALALGQGMTAGDVLVSGDDFYAHPRLSPDGSRLAWLTWNHPAMPWNGTRLSLAEAGTDGRLGAPVHIAGSASESIWQPGFADDGELIFMSDRSGWWNPFAVRGGAVVQIAQAPLEFGRPLWQLGGSTWACPGPGPIVASCAEKGSWRLTTIDRQTGRIGDVAADLEPGDSLAATATHAVTVAGFADRPEAVCRIDLVSGYVDPFRTQPLHSARAQFSAPEVIEFPAEGGLIAHAFYYPTATSRAPLIVVAHGGPTFQATRRLNLEVQYWTSRGFAVAEVNYGGSTGFGRAYRDRLKGQWGIVDVADCVNAATYLVNQGKADPDRLVIRGRSAGGYTALAALAFKPGVFKAGASYYGIGDLEAMANETHWFESHYHDTLIAPYPAARTLYRERSPIYFVDRMTAPIIFFQGLEDLVVPPGQARTMFEAVRRKGIKTDLLLFEGEQHGFRRSETIVRCLEAEFSFYKDALGLS